MSLLRRLPVLVACLASLLMLAGVAGARLKAERASDPAQVALCMGDGERAGGHDCQDCCLPAWSAAPALAPAPMPWSGIAGLLLPGRSDFGLGGFGLARVVARGPPALA